MGIGSAPIPMRRFDYQLVEAPMEGVLTNVDRDLQRRVNWSDQVQNQDSGMWLTTINLMMRFATNSYHAVKFLAGDQPEDPRRKRNYMLVLPGINRQLLDLLFSLVYMLDDYPARCMEYQRSGWREFHNEYDHTFFNFGTDPAWSAYLNGLQQVLDRWEGPCRITQTEKADPKLIPYWRTPHQLQKKPTKSQEYLKYLNTWIYSDISAQAHLSFGGLMKATPMLLAEIMGGQRQEEVENQIVPRYHFQQISRTAITTLAIATEIDFYFKLGNGDRILMLWNVFGEWVVEAKEMYEKRYRELLDKVKPKS